MRSVIERIFTGREPVASRAMRKELLGLLGNACRTAVIPSKDMASSDDVSVDGRIVRSWRADCGHCAVRNVFLTKPVTSDSFEVDHGTLLVGDTHSAYSITVGTSSYYAREDPFRNEFAYHEDPITKLVLASFRAHIGGDSPSRTTCPVPPQLDLSQDEVYAL